MWYIDGYDKFKFYGIVIYGCIDGYLWLILWLEVVLINNDFKVVVNYFINVVKERGGCFLRFWNGKCIYSEYLVFFM